MSASLRELNRRVDALTAPAFDITDIVERGNRRMRRRRALVATGAVATVAATIITAIVLASPEQRSHRPVNHPTPTPATPTASARSLTFTDDYREDWNPEPHWLMQSIQYGDQRIRLEFEAEQMDVTDDGVVVVSEEGGVYLSNGATVERIGQTNPQDLSWASGRTESGNDGSLVSWFTSDGPTASLNVYDTHQRRLVAESSLPQCPNGCPQLGIVGDRVYFDDPVDETTASGPRNRILFLDVSTGEVTGIEMREFWEDLRHHPRALVKSNDPSSGEVVAVDAWLAKRDDRLVLQWLVDETGPDVDGDGRGDGRAVFGYGGYDTNGRPLDLRLPAGYAATDSYRLFQWIDDDRFAAIGAVGDGSMPAAPHGKGYGDILICDLAAERCRVASQGPARRPAYTAGGFRLVPDLDAPN
jgi:hypothetical protein